MKLLCIQRNEKRRRMEQSEKPPPVPRIARTRKAGGASRVLRACAKRVPKPEKLDGCAFDGSAKGAEFFVDAFVSAVDLTNIIDRGPAFGAECSDEERHAGTDVGGFEVRAQEFALSCNDDAVRVTEDNLCAHSDKGIDEKHAALQRRTELLFSSRKSASPPRSRMISIITSTSLMRGTWRMTSTVVRRLAASAGRTSFLLPPGIRVPLS